MDAQPNDSQAKNRAPAIDWDAYGRNEAPSRRHLTDASERSLLCGFVELFADRARDQYLLEVGCGDGFWLAVLRDLGFRRLVGIDCSMPLLEKAAEKGLDVRYGDLYDLEVVDVFDGVLICDTLEHLPDPVEALRRVHAALKTQGTLYLIVPVYESLADRWERFWRRRTRAQQARDDDRTHLQAFSTPELLQLLDECYFSIASVRHIGNVSPWRRRPIEWTRKGRDGKWALIVATSLFYVDWGQDATTRSDTTLESAPVGSAPEATGAETGPPTSEAVHEGDATSDTEPLDLDETGPEEETTTPTSEGDLARDVPPAQEVAESDERRAQPKAVPAQPTPSRDADDDATTEIRF